MPRWRRIKLVAKAKAAAVAVFALNRGALSHLHFVAYRATRGDNGPDKSCAADTGKWAPCLLALHRLTLRDGYDPALANLSILVPLVCTGGQGPTHVAKPEAASSGRLFLCPGLRRLKSPLRTGGLPTQGASDAATSPRLRCDLATCHATPSSA
jgi:hypothetical protein